MTEFKIVLLKSTVMTASLALYALLIGFIFAIILAIWENSPIKPIAWLATIFITLMRSLPEILVVFLIYFGSAQLMMILSGGFSLNFGCLHKPIALRFTNVTVNPFICGVVALATIYAVYASQTLRGALQSVPEEQREAGQALGLSKKDIFFCLVMPQMWRHALPGLGNQWLVLLKDTSLVSLISVNNLTLQAKSIITLTQEPFVWYMVAAFIYLIMTLFSQYIIKIIEIYICGKNA